MNILLTLGLLLIIGYIMGWLLDKIGLPKIIGYIITGIVFSPNTINFIDVDILKSTQPLMDVCLAFIAFEVGGSLKWSKIKAHKKEIISITLLASFFPFLFIVIGVFSFNALFPTVLSFDFPTALAFAFLLGALASPTAPAATLAIMHQYKARGKVSDTIMGVAALDDVLGILLFSFTLGFVAVFNGGEEAVLGNTVFNSLYEITISIFLGVIMALIINLIAIFFKKTSEGQWVVTLFALIILCAGLSKLLHVDELLACMTMGIVVVNKCKQKKLIFRILERYTEELIFLFFFLLSGLYLDISTIPNATILIMIFVLFRIVGKYVGANVGAYIVKADSSIQKYTAGGLLPQAGIVIGLVLSVYQKDEFREISEMLLTIIMGATIINELIGPIAAKYSLKKSGEITLKK